MAHINNTLVSNISTNFRHNVHVTRMYHIPNTEFCSSSFENITENGKMKIVFIRFYTFMVIKHTHSIQRCSSYCAECSRIYIDFKFTENKISFVTDTLTETGYSTETDRFKCFNEQRCARLSVVNVCRRSILIRFWNWNSACKHVIGALCTMYTVHTQ